MGPGFESLKVHQKNGQNRPFFAVFKPFFRSFRKFAPNCPQFYKLKSCISLARRSCSTGFYFACAGGEDFGTCATSRGNGGKVQGDSPALPGIGERDGREVLSCTARDKLVKTAAAGIT